ncbi:MAG: ligase-associated DNA damage response endonuclease PdeM [Flavobacteriales bacterium]
MRKRDSIRTTSVRIANREVLLHPGRVVFLPDQSLLVCSDIHVGKTDHFRRHGIPVPRMAAMANAWRLAEVMESLAPSHVLFLGDLMHSSANREWEEFVDMLDQFPGLKRTLVKGNHDVEGESFFIHHGFEVAHEWTDGFFRFVHVPEAKPKEGFHTFAGHLHPAVRMVGPARQSLRLPCFWLGENQSILPAFGEFTGHVLVRPLPGDRIYVVAENEVIGVT